MKLNNTRWLAALWLLVAGAGINAQQHSYAPSDIERGRGLYQANCLGCHGNDGRAVEGANLSNGRFRRASSDEQLIALIRNGIPNTLMIEKPQLDYGELRALVAYLRSMSTLAPEDESGRDIVVGDPSRGEALFFGKADCVSCHGVNGGGSVLYQDLAGIGAQRSAASLEDAMTLPNKEVMEGQRFFQVTDSQGRRHEGKLLNQDRYSVQLLTHEEALVSFLKADLEDWGFIDSPMPSYLDVLSGEEISHLVAYLLSLKE